MKKLLIDGRVPRRVRERVPILADEAGVVWLGGFGPHQDRLAAPGAEALEIHRRPRDMRAPAAGRNPSGGKDHFFFCGKRNGP